MSDDCASLVVMGHRNDGSDGHIAFSSVGEALVLGGFAKTESIDPVTVQKALWQGDVAKKFTFSRSWCVQRPTLLC